MTRCIIVGGAEIHNYDVICQKLYPEDFFVFCDSGLRHQKSLNRDPNLIVGDFDSYNHPNCDIETIVLPCEKDDTDTAYAVKECIKRGYSEFLLVGVVGQRLDHSLGNISLLLMLDALGLKGTLLDDYSEMEIVSTSTAYIDDSYSYFSLISIGGDAHGVTVKNAKYEITHADIPCEYQYGISNEVSPGKMAEVSIASGRLLLLKVFHS